MPVIQSVLKGYNATIFAYGNTGAGKTFTMEGTPTKPGIRKIFATPFRAGIIPLTIYGLLGKASLAELKMSALEIYNERVHDLLADHPRATDLPLREDSTRTIIIPNLISLPIRRQADFTAAFAKATQNRVTGATGLNATSSRSHFCIYLQVGSFCFDWFNLYRLEQRPASPNFISSILPDQRIIEGRAIRVIA